MNTPDRSAAPMRDVPLFGAGPWFAVRLTLLVTLLTAAGLVGASLWIEFVDPQELAWWQLLGIVPSLAALALAELLAFIGPWESFEVEVPGRRLVRLRALQAVPLLLALLVILLLFFTPLGGGYRDARPVPPALWDASFAYAAWSRTIAAYRDARFGKPTLPPRRTPGRVGRLGAWANTRLDAAGHRLERIADRLRRTR